MKVTSILGLWMLCALCLCSCTDEGQEAGGIMPDVTTTPVRLSLVMTPMLEAGSVTRARGDNSLDLVLGEEAGKAANGGATRADGLTDAQESAVNDICVFQFDSGSKLIYSEYATLTDGELTADISLASGTGTCTVYVLANVGNLTAKAASGTTLTDFKKLAAEVASGMGSGQNLPMCGHNDSYNSNVDNASLSVPLTRSVAKVCLNLTTPTAGDVFNVTSVKLMNVAKELYYVETAAAAPVADMLTTYAGGSANTVSWYIPENKAGSNSVTDWTDRYEGNAPATATYILIEGSYTPKGGTARDMAYTIYLGAGDNAGDFNVARNTKYTVNAAIKGTNMNDGRVLVGRDLSAAGKETANCYVVNTTEANQWYRFKATIRGNGAATPAQISYTGADIAVGAEIAPTNAALVWETSSTLEYVGYSKNGYIVFKTGAAKEGNAVVAAKNGTTTLWSWHIWTTAAFDRDNIAVQTYETKPRTVSGYADVSKRTYKMMDRNLGSASGTATKIAEDAIKTYGVYFQFGRKDPFPAAGVMTRVDNADIVPVYDANGNKIEKNTHQVKNSTITTDRDQAAVTEQLAYAVENPLIFILRDDDDKGTTYGGDDTNPSFNWIFAAHPAKGTTEGSIPWKASNKLWGSGLVNELSSLALGTIVEVKKTIYDPCPYGYHMPPQEVWTNFTTSTTAYNTNNTAEYNVVAVDKHNQTDSSIGFTDSKFQAWGRRYFTTGIAETAVDGASNVAFYPAAGCRRGLDGYLNDVGWGCYVWSASPYSATSQNGGFLSTYSDWVYSVIRARRSDAFPVRCVRETTDLN